MTSSTFHTVQDNESNVLSGITNDASVSDTTQILSVNDKKRKAEQIYLSGQWKDEDEYEITKLRQVIRNHIFKHLKFVKGEGTIPSSRKDRKTKKRVQLTYGMCHERPDLTKQGGYELKILRLMGMSEINTSITAQALWWKTYNSYVHHEIKQMRGRINAAMKLAITQGVFQNVLILNYNLRYSHRHFQRY